MQNFIRHKIHLLEINKCFPQNLGPSCGRQLLTNRIIGGSEVVPNSLPWQVGIAVKGSRNPQCGGTLISIRHVLTSVICVTAR